MDVISTSWDWEQAFQDFWKKHHILSILLLAALLFDTLTTIHFMQAEGVELEFHPLVRVSAMLLGPTFGTILSAFLFKAVAGIMLAIYLRPYSAWVLAAPIITSTFAGFYNLSNLYSAAPYLL